MKLKNGMIVHCDTKEKAIRLLKECHKQGWKWRDGSGIVNKGVVSKCHWLFNDSTVYCLHGEGITVGDVLYYESEGNTFSFEELFKEKEEKKQVKIYRKPDYIHNDVNKVITNEPRVIVYLDTGEKGISKCCPGDEFNKELGYNIAYQRATIERLKNEMKDAEGILKYLTR